MRVGGEVVAADLRLRETFSWPTLCSGFIPRPGGWFHCLRTSAHRLVPADKPTTLLEAQRSDGVEPRRSRSRYVTRRQYNRANEERAKGDGPSVYCTHAEQKA